MAALRTVSKLNSGAFVMSVAAAATGLACVSERHENGAQIAPEAQLSKTPQASVSPPPPQPVEAPAPVRSDKERAVMLAILSDEYTVFSQGGKALVGDQLAGNGYVAVSADELQREYERNEVAGDKKFRGNHLVLRGKVSDIKRSVGENYFLTLKGGTNRFMQPTARMADGHIEFLAAIEKGQNVDLICEGDGMLMGSAVASNCMPASSWVDAMVNAKLNEPLASTDTMTNKLWGLASSVSQKLAQTSPCWSAPREKSCSKEIEAVTELLFRPKATKPKSETASKAVAQAAQVNTKR